MTEPSMKMRRAAWLVVVAVAAGGCSSRTPPETTPPPPESTSAGRRAADAAAPVDLGAPAPLVHTVERGETLWALSRRYGVSVDELVRANGLAAPDRLSIGARLLIPGDVGAGGWTWPVADGEVLSGFGVRRGAGMHRGLDIRARAGERVLAAWPGTVVYVGSEMGGYGRAVIIDHGDGLTSLYGHNAELLVGPGERVDRGQAIAVAGRTGNATTVHCHFEVRRHAEAVDPLRFLTSSGR